MLLMLGLTARLAAGKSGATVGDGLVGEYYEGMDFNRLITTRRAAAIAFDWAMRPPAAGVPAEYFSVRWKGWLVPPATGRYVLHATVDDGIRVWLNDQLVLDEWRPQPVRHFAVVVPLQAGRPYKLRVKYFQAILDTRARLAWVLPSVAQAPPPGSWRNWWGLATKTPEPEVISPRFLYSRNPLPTPMAPPQRATLPGTVRPAIPTAQLRPVAVRPPAPPTQRRLVRVAAPPVATAALPMLTPATAAPDTARRERLAHLAAGEAMALPELGFEQGQARLLPTACAVLNGLATTLTALPALHLEVQGHTDNVGDAGLNQLLSQQRADAVCAYLTAHGVAASRLRAVGYGGTQPVADNADPNQRPRNRRVVLRRR